MLILKNVHGSKEASEPLIVGKDTVYVHTNIHPYEDEEMDNLYEYDEIQYTKDEYLFLLSQKNTDLENAMCEMSMEYEEQIADLENALCELSESEVE